MAVSSPILSNRLSGFLDLSRGGNRTFAGDWSSLRIADWIIVIAVMSCLLLIWPFLYIGLRRLTRELAVWPDFIDETSLENMTPVTYGLLRKRRDMFVEIQSNFDRPFSNERVVGAYLKNSLLRVVATCNQQIRKVDEVLGSMNASEEDSKGFTSIAQETLWKNRSKAYKYRL